MPSERAADEITAVIAAHSPDVLAYFTRRVPEAADAADLLAETLLIVWRRASRLPSGDEEARAWMFGIARNVLLHHRRGFARRLALTERLRAVLATTTHPGFSPDPEYEELHRAISALTDIDRDIIGLVHWEGFSLVDAGRILGLKEGTVRSRYHRAKARLRDALVDGNSVSPTRAIPR